VPAAVVGVLAEDLEAPRYPERELERASRHAAERLEDEIEEDLFPKGFVVAETELCEPGKEVGGGHEGGGSLRQESGGRITPASYPPIC